MVRECLFTSGVIFSEMNPSFNGPTASNLCRFHFIPNAILRKLSRWHFFTQVFVKINNLHWKMFASCTNHLIAFSAVDTYWQALGKIERGIVNNYSPTLTSVKNPNPPTFWSFLLRFAENYIACQRIFIRNCWRMRALKEACLIADYRSEGDEPSPRTLELGVAQNQIGSH